VDIINHYVIQERLNFSILDSAGTWLDAGTLEDYLYASVFIGEMESTTQRKVGSPELAALENGWITRDQFKTQGLTLSKSNYGLQLLELAEKFKSEIR
jgi:glucose-1-phosphate thymidylyltransferase